MSAEQDHRLIPSMRTGDFRAERWQAGQMGGLLVLCGILAGFAAYRWGEARATWRRLKDGKTVFRNQRKTAWRHAGRATLYIGIVIILILIATNYFK
jgi:hypothetical protein